MSAVIAEPISEPPAARLNTASIPDPAITSAHIFVAAIAVSVECGDGFHTIASPHTAPMQGVPCPRDEREVEGGDDADCSERMPLLIHPVPGPFRRHGQAVQLA